MPYEWVDMTQGAPVISGAFSYADGDQPALRLTVWPHRSLSRKGFVIFISVTFAMLMIPLLAFLGTIALWALLPYLMGSLALTWYLIQRSYQDGTLREDLTIWSDRVELTRSNPRTAAQTWHANPHWARVTLHADGGPVEDYLTMTGNSRTVEIGGFLAPEERRALYPELTDALVHLRTPTGNR